MPNKYWFRDCMKVDIQDKDFFVKIEICLLKKNSEINLLCSCMMAIPIYLLWKSFRSVSIIELNCGLADILKNKTVDMLVC